MDRRLSTDQLPALDNQKKSPLEAGSNAGLLCFAYHAALRRGGSL